MENIDDKIADFLGNIFSSEPIMPSRLVGKKCTLRFDSSDSIIVYDTVIRWVFHRIYHTRFSTPCVMDVRFIFDGGGFGKVDFPISRQNEEGVNLSELSTVNFEGLPIYQYSKGRGNIILR